MTTSHERPSSNSTGSHVRLVGAFALRHGGTTLHLTHGAQRLVAFVAYHDEAVCRCFIAGSLWPEVSEERAHGSLRTAIWSCRHLHECRFLGISRSDVWLEDGVVVDYRRILRRVADDESVGFADGAIGSAELQTDLLLGWYDEWVVVARERFRQLRLHALDRIADGLMQSGRYREAIDAGLASVAAEPLREVPHRLVIRAHLAEGNRSEAMRHYIEYTKRLRTALDVGPSSQLRELVADNTLTLA